MDISKLTPHYNHFLEIARGLLWKRGIPNHKDVARDLVHDLMITLSESDLEIKNPKHYFARALVFQLTINSSKFYYKYRRFSVNKRDITALSIENEPFDVTEKINEYHQEHLLALALQKLEPIDRALIQALYIEGKTMKKLSQEIGIPYESIRGQIIKIKKQIKDEIKRTR